MKNPQLKTLAAAAAMLALASTSPWLFAQDSAEAAADPAATEAAPAEEAPAEE